MPTNSGAVHSVAGSRGGFLHKNKLKFYNVKHIYDKTLTIAIDGGIL